MSATLAPTPQAHLVEGPVGSGKTERLVQQAASLASRGVRPEDMLVFAASPDAALSLAERLERAGLPDVAVTCARFAALGILAAPEARRVTGRSGRLATPFQEQVVFEDMKTSGVAPRRLREMMRFFFRNWTELAAEGDWLVPGEEGDAHQLLQEVLAFDDVVLEPEATALALRALQADDALREREQRPWVLADDYQALSRASQHLVNLLARDGIMVAANPRADFPLLDSYPFMAGVEEFAQANPGCARTVLEAPARPGKASRVLEGSSPREELDLIVDAVGQALRDGMQPEEAFVLCPSARRQRELAAALADRSIPARSLPASPARVQNFCDREGSAAARLVALLDLAATPRDALAWRCWCAFDDHLAASSAFEKLRARCGEAGASLPEGLAGLALDPAFGSGALDGLRERHARGLAALERLAGLQGDALIEAAAQELGIPAGAPAVRAVKAWASPAGDGAERADAPTDARALADRIALRACAPRLEGRGVAVGGFRQLAGAAPRLLVLASFVNGVFPSRDYFDGTKTPPDKQAAWGEQDARLAAQSAARARDEVIASHFAEASLDEADALRLQVDRVRLRRGERRASVSPSIHRAAALGTGA